jgi:hypothetical protein
MKKIKIIFAKLLFIFLFVVSVFSCNPNKIMKKVNFNYSSKPTKQDEEFIKYTIREFMNVGFDRYQVYGRDYSTMDRQRISIKVDRIYYAPDSLKFIGWIILEIPKEIAKNSFTIRKGIDFYYDGNAIIGIRNRTTEIWNIYPYELQTVIGFEDVEKTRNVFNEYFFEGLAKSGYSGYNNKGKWTIVDLKYNVDDPEFWRGPVFDTSMYRGHCIFQVDEFCAPEFLYGKPRKLVTIPKINYPDSIISFYK